LTTNELLTNLFKTLSSHLQIIFCLEVINHGRLSCQAHFCVQPFYHLFVFFKSAIQKGLAEFGGVGRRFSDLGTVNWASGRARLIDDYGHHPTELAVTLTAMREAFPDQRLVMVYQPHRYTRTRDHFDDFVSVLGEGQSLILLEVYSAGEQLIDGADSHALAKAIRSRGMVDPIVVADQSQLAAVLIGVLADNDILLMQGAGDISRLAMALAESENLEVLL